jgi:chromosome partitioning protein
MKTLSLIAQKGGTGKTTLSIHLAVQAGLSRLKVLLIDLDPQASATAWWRRRSAQFPSLLQGQSEDLEQILSTAQNQRYDLAVIDTAPHNAEGAGVTARLSDYVLIPSRPAILDLDAIGASTELVLRLGAKAEILLNACPPPTRYGTPQIVLEARQALVVYGIPVSEVTISQRAAFSHALIDGRAVNEYDGRGKAALELERLWQGIKQDLML